VRRAMARELASAFGCEEAYDLVTGCCSCCVDCSVCEGCNVCEGAVGSGLDTAADCMDALSPFMELLGKVISLAASPCCWPIVYCFEAEGDLGPPWDVKMEWAPLKKPIVCCCSLCCVHCTQAYVRYIVLDKDMSKYKCFQGYADGPYCCAVCKPGLPCTFTAGTYGDAGNPFCLCLEVCCCPFCAFDASREYQRADRHLGYDPTEIRVDKCLEFFGCCAECCICCGCCLKCCGCLAGCCLGEEDFSESSERLGNACHLVALGIIKGMRWIIRIATACMSAQMMHEAQLSRQPAPAKPGVVLGAPQQEVMGTQQLNAGAAPPVPRHVAQGFLQALTSEYVNGNFGAVGGFFDRLPAEQSNTLAPFEDQVRDSGNAQAAINDISRQWGM